jgi:hypothetical protein
MNMPKEQDRFEIAQSMQLHRASIFRRPSQELVVLQILLPNMLCTQALAALSVQEKVQVIPINLFLL